MATVTEIGKNKVKVEFTIQSELMEAAMQESYQKLKGKFNIPGFRRGKAPKAIIEKYYGDKVFFEDAFETILPAAYELAIAEEKIEAVSKPENVDIVSMEPELVVSAEVYVKPEVKLGDYMGVKVEFKEAPFSDELVDAELEKVREQNARFDDVERAAKMGDKVIIDYSGSVDGVKFDGGTAEAQTLDLGSGMFIPGFEEQVVGMNIGEEKDITVKFPEDYRADDLAGKDAVFAVKLIAVKEKQLPELDDELAQDISEFDTLEEYKADVASKLKERHERTQKLYREDALVKKIIEGSEMDIPDCMIDDQVDYQVREMEYNLRYQGLNMDLYLQYMGTTLDAIKEEMRPSAEMKVKSQLVLGKIHDIEKVEVTDEDMEKEIAEVAKAMGREIGDYKEKMTDRDREYIKDRVEYDLLIQKMVDAAEFVEPKEKKAPAKKKAAKKAEETEAAPEE